MFCLQEDIAKGLMSEFNLGCTDSDIDHTYRVYVSTFLGYGGNVARKRYEKSLIQSTVLQGYTSINTSQGWVKSTIFLYFHFHLEKLM